MLYNLLLGSLTTVILTLTSAVCWLFRLDNASLVYLWCPIVSICLNSGVRSTQRFPCKEPRTVNHVCMGEAVYIILNESV